MTPEEVLEVAESARSQGELLVSMAVGGPITTKVGGSILRGVASRIGIRAGVSSSATFASAGKLTDHFVRHGADFGAKTAAAYQRQASRFLTGSPGKSVLQKTRANGDVVRYNPKTDQFGVIAKNGNLRT